MFSVNNKTVFDSKEKIWRGPKVNIRFGSECSVGGEALKALIQDPEHISQISYTSGKEFTNREIATLTIRVAQHFRDVLKIPQCEVIGLCACNSDYVAPLVFGAMLAGLTMSTLDPSFDKDGIKHIYSLTKPKIMLCDGNIYETIKEAMDEIKLDITIYTMNNHIAGVPEITEFLNETGSEDAFVPEPLKEGWNQTAIITCSSGTTGPPKGVSASHASLLGKTVNDIGLRSLLSFSTLYWTSGVYILLHGTIGNSTRVISETAFSIEDFSNIVERYKIEGVMTSPSQLAMLIADSYAKQRDFSSLKQYLCGGSAVPIELIDKFHQFLPKTLFTIVYGMTESGGCASCINPQLNCVGRVLQNFEVKIIDDDGNPLGPNEKGEICIKPKFLWPGYYNNPEATANTYVDGWIRSGDIGYFNDECNLFVVDRKKEIMKYNNFHFSPSEIESVIYAMKGVAEVSVCGIPDDISSFLPAAAIVRVPGCELTEKEVIDHVANNMAHFKQLHGGVYFLEELPKTVSGKIIRRRVTEICIQLRADIDN